MPTINATVNGEAVVAPTTSWDTENITIADGSVNADGQLAVDIPSKQNNGNTENTVEVTVSAVTGGSLAIIAIDNPATGSFEFTTGSTATMEIPAGANATIKLFFDLDEEPGVGEAVNLEATYTATWV